MKKKFALILILSLLISSALLFAALTQKKHVTMDIGEKIGMLSDNEARKGEYTVRLLPCPGNTFGFDIRKGNAVIYLQQSNPFYPTPEGFISPNEAFNVAWWIVEKFKTGKPPAVIDFNESLEKELNIQRRHNR